MIDPLAGGATLSVAGLTLSVPAPGVPLVLLPALGLGLAVTVLAPADDGAAVTLAVGRPAPGPVAVCSTPARAVALAVAPARWGPVRPSLPSAGSARPVTLGVAAPAGGTPWCGGTAIQVTPAATAAAVPATAPAWTGRACSHGGPG